LNKRNQKIKQTIEVDAEVVSEFTRQGKKKPSSKFNGSSKKVGVLPWREMFTFYVKGERVINGGLKHNTTPTYEDVAERFNCSKHTISAYASKNDWVTKRDAYRNRLANEFSFYGQMAADINGEVLATAAGLVKKIKAKVFDPTFLPEQSRIVTIDEESFVELDSGELIPLPSMAQGKNRKPGMGSEVKDILDLAKSLETINRICNTTVQIEVENAKLMEDASEGLIGESEKAEHRMRQIQEMTQRVGINHSNESKRERLAQARAVREVNTQLRNI
jgi:hypothetical protein